MGMIQIDMPMPTNCLDCPACNEYLMCAIPINGRKWGENDVHEYGQGRPEWCPMKEQEAIKPFSDDDGAYWCGSCHEDMVWHQKFCSNCGRPVLWEVCEVNERH